MIPPYYIILNMQNHSLVTFKDNQYVKLPYSVENKECYISDSYLIQHRDSGRSIR